MLGSTCSHADFTCHQDWIQILLTSLICFTILLYCLWFCKYLVQQFARLQRSVYPNASCLPCLAGVAVPFAGGSDISAGPNLPDPVKPSNNAEVNLGALGGANRQLRQVH